MESFSSRPDDHAIADELAGALLLLTRMVGVYPQNHPQVTKAVAKMSRWASMIDSESISVGITSTELIIDGKFYGGKQSRMEMLARRLHTKKIARIIWKTSVSDKDAYNFARVLADKTLSGEEIVKALEDNGIRDIQVIPLDLESIHKLIRLSEDKDGESKLHETLWNRIQEISGNPKELGKALASEEFWIDLNLASGEEKKEFIDILVSLGSMLDRSLHTVSSEVREKIGEKLANLAKDIEFQDLARLVDVFMSDESPTEFSLRSLMKYLKGDKLAGVLGGLVALGGEKDRRIREFVRRFIPADSLPGLIGLVREWKQTGEKMGNTFEVWEWLESYLLNIDENSYMGEGYRETLDEMTARMRGGDSGALSFQFHQDVEINLDRLYAGMVYFKMPGAESLLQRRIEQRLENLDGPGALEFIENLEQVVPEVVNNSPELLGKVFGGSIADVKDLSPRMRQRFMSFAIRHEAFILEVLLKGLAEDNRISARKFYVDILSSLSSDAVPGIIRKAKYAPWYFVRNIAIILGKIRDPRAFPYLRTLVDHENPKVRREAMRTMTVFGENGKKVLASIASSFDRTPAEKSLAKLMISRIS